MRKDTLKIVIVGHVDHGKSTLIGRLLYDTNSLPREKLAEIKKISRELGKDTELAYLTDQLREERERNVTIDTTQIFFKTPKRDYVIIDAPGHVEFVKNMISGASLAEAAVLITDVKEGVMEQTRRHSYIVSMLGIDRVIVVVNKMDLIDYKEKRFDEVKSELLGFLEDVKVRPSFVIPVSAREGANISRKSKKMRWYGGPTFLGALDSFSLSKKSTDERLIFPIQDVYELDGEKIIVGRVASGMIEQGQKVVLLPSARDATIEAIKVFQDERTTANKGESIGLTLEEPLHVNRGEVVVQKENPPAPVNQFKGNIFWMSPEPLQLNKKITLRCATQEVGCVAEKIEKRIDSSTLELIEEDAKELRLNEAGIAIFRTEKPIVVEKFPLVEELGRFVIEHEYNLQGAGIIAE